MRGVGDREDLKNQRSKALAYQVALLMRCSELPDQGEWITGKRDRQAYIRKFNEKWDKVDAALARTRAKK